MAIETGVKEVLETDFAGQIGAGEVAFALSTLQSRKTERWPTGMR